MRAADFTTRCPQDGKRNLVKSSPGGEDLGEGGQHHKFKDGFHGFTAPGFPRGGTLAQNAPGFFALNDFTAAKFFSAPLREAQNFFSLKPGIRL